MLRDQPAHIRWGTGFTYPWRGFRFLLANPILWPWVAVPILINLSLVALAGVTTMTLVPGLFNLLWSPQGGWQEALWWGLALTTAGSLFIFCLVILYFCAGLIAIPFNDRLSEQVEFAVLGPRSEPFSWSVLLSDLWMSVRHSLASLFLWVVVMVLLFGLELIPVLGSLLHFVLGVLASAFFLSREMMDGAMSRRRLGYGHKMRIVGSDLALFEGLGMATAMLLWVPLLNFVSLPVSVVGGTLLFLRLEEERALPGATADTPYDAQRQRVARKG